jgi:DNA-binding transcriptional MerR regulator
MCEVAPDTRHERSEQAAAPVQLNRMHRPTQRGSRSLRRQLGHARPEGLVTIAELCAVAGVTRATVYHYCAVGLLPEPVKTAQNMAYYAPECIERVKVVRALAERHLPLAEVSAVIEEHGLDTARAAIEQSGEASFLLDRLRSTGRSPSTREELLAASSLDEGDLDALEEIGLLRRVFEAPAGPRIEGHENSASGSAGAACSDDPYDSLSVKLVEAISRMRQAGMTQGLGFVPADVLLYVDAMSTVVEAELRYFASGLPPERSLPIMRAALEHAESLCLVARRRLLMDVIGKGASPGTRRWHPGGDSKDGDTGQPDVAGIVRTVRAGMQPASEGKEGRLQRLLCGPMGRTMSTTTISASSGVNWSASLQWTCARRWRCARSSSRTPRSSCGSSSSLPLRKAKSTSSIWAGTWVCQPTRCAR